MDFFFTLNKPIYILVLYNHLLNHLWFKISMNLSKDECLMSLPNPLFVHRTPIEI